MHKRQIFVGILSTILTLSLYSEEVLHNPPPNVEVSSEFALKVSEEHAKIIEEIVLTIGQSSLFSLGFKQNHLKTLGKKLRGMGTLQFLGYIYQNDNLRVQMKVIYKSTLKWNGFMDGIKPGFNQEFESAEMLQQLKGFARFTHLNYDELYTKVKSKDWNNFVAMIFDL